MKELLFLGVSSESELKMISAIEQVLSTYEFALRRALPGRLHGEHIQAQPGDGYEIRDFVPLGPEHSWRDVDHKMSARMGEWYVREMYADKEVDIWLLLDVKRAMRLGYEASKFAHALNLLLLSFVWARGSVSRLGAIQLGLQGGPAVKVRPVLQGRELAMDTLEWLRKSPRPERLHHQPIAESLSEATGIIQRPSVVFVASDTFDPDVVAPLRQLSYRHELTVFSVYDAVDELTMPLSGWVNLEDADSGRQSSGLISRRQRKLAADDRAREIANFDKGLNGLPLAHVKVSTADNPFDAFVQFARNYPFRERRQSA